MNPGLEWSKVLGKADLLQKPGQISKKNFRPD